MSAPVSLIRSRLPPTFFFFFFNDTATTEIYTLSLHDALPISLPFVGSWPCRIRGRMVAPDAKAFTGTDGLGVLSLWGVSICWSGLERDRVRTATAPQFCSVNLVPL